MIIIVVNETFVISTKKLFFIKYRHLKINLYLFEKITSSHKNYIKL